MNECFFSKKGRKGIKDFFVFCSMNKKKYGSRKIVCVWIETNGYREWEMLLI